MPLNSKDAITAKVALVASDRYEYKIASLLDEISTCVQVRSNPVDLALDETYKSSERAR